MALRFTSGSRLYKQREKKNRKDTSGEAKIEGSLGLSEWEAWEERENGRPGTERMGGL